MAVFGVRLLIPSMIDTPLTFLIRVSRLVLLLAFILSQNGELQSQTFPSSPHWMCSSFWAIVAWQISGTFLQVQRCVSIESSSLRSCLSRPRSFFFSLAA